MPDINQLAKPRDVSGNWILQVVGPNGHRASFNFGAVTQHDAQWTTDRVHELNTIRKLGQTIPPHLLRWLAGISDELHHRLSRAGFVEPRVKVPTLQGFLEESIARAEEQLKPSTIVCLKSTKDRLLAHFDGSTKLDRITTDDAMRWRRTMKNAGLSEPTLRHHARNVKRMMSQAVKDGGIAADPFAELPSASTNGTKRYVTIEESEKILAAMPNIAHRTLFALARFAGLRVPSETHNLTWKDIDWDNNRMRVYSPKAHRFDVSREDAIRTVPIEPRLATILREAFEAAPKGSAQVVAISRNNVRRALQGVPSSRIGPRRGRPCGSHARPIGGTRCPSTSSANGSDTPPK